jgi:hypothetical protein
MYRAWPLAHVPHVGNAVTPFVLRQKRSRWRRAFHTRPELSYDDV